MTHLVQTGTVYCARTRRAALNGARTQRRQGLGTNQIARDAHWDSARPEAGLTLLFPAGARPSAAVIERALGQREGGNLVQASEAGNGRKPPGRLATASRISSQRGRAEGWIELLASGLTFDLAGLLPGPPLAPPDARHFFGLPRDAAGHRYEVIALSPGPHLAGAGAMLSVEQTTPLPAERLRTEKKGDIVLRVTLESAGRAVYELERPAE